MLGFVVGLAAEARIAARCGCPVQVGGGTPAGAEVAAARLIEAGATALVSFGLAGGLDPLLRPGVVIVPSVVLWQDQAFSADPVLAKRFGGFTGHTTFGGYDVVPDAAGKHDLHVATLAHAIDLESGAIARIAVAYRLPFIVVRAICDPAERTVPPAALIALRSDGGIGFGNVLRSVLARPAQVPDLLRLAHDAMTARRALMGVTKRFRTARWKSA